MAVPNGGNKYAYGLAAEDLRLYLVALLTPPIFRNLNRF